MNKITAILAAMTFCVAAAACGPSLHAKQPASSDSSTSGFALDSMPEVTVPDISIPDVSVETPDSSAPETDAGNSANPGGSSASSDDRITDESGSFVYEGKLQQIGDDENGYIQVPLGYVQFQDEDVEGLTQYSDVTGKNIVTLDRYEGVDYQTAANNLRAYMETQENLEGLTGATVSPNGYTALQLYGHYTDGYFIVCWLIEDPADSSSTYYLALEFDADHQYLMACSSTFQTVADYHASNPE